MKNIKDTNHKHVHIKGYEITLLKKEKKQSMEFD
jgi:hypothetical protein